MEVFILWIVFSFVVAVIASSRGHSATTFTFISFFLSPLVGLILAIALKPSTNIPESTPDQGPSVAYLLGRKISKNITESAPVQATDLKICPFCAEKIQAKAIVCRYCGRDLPVNMQSLEVPPEKELWHDDIVVLTTTQVRVKKDSYPLPSIASLEVISTGSSWCVELRTTDGAMRRLGFSPTESAARELLERIEQARTALLNWNPEPAAPPAAA